MNFSQWFLMVLIALSTTACKDPRPLSSDQLQHQQQELISSQGNVSVGMPSITKFQEKRLFKDILEMRDSAVNTFTYTQDMNGNMHKLCDSIGYGIAAGTQYTNPSRVVRESDRSSSQVIQQADPNGLFTPSTSVGNWVMCKEPDTQKTSPVYSEQRIIVAQFPLK